MAGEKIEGIMRDCLKALAAKDIDKVLSYSPRTEIGLHLKVCLRARRN